MLYYCDNYDISIVQLNSSIIDHNKMNICKCIYYIYYSYNIQ